MARTIHAAVAVASASATRAPVTRRPPAQRQLGNAPGQPMSSGRPSTVRADAASGPARELVPRHDNFLAVDAFDSAIEIETGATATLRRSNSFDAAGLASAVVNRFLLGLPNLGVEYVNSEPRLEVTEYLEQIAQVMASHVEYCRVHGQPRPGYLHRILHHILRQLEDRLAAEGAYSHLVKGASQELLQIFCQAAETTAR